MNKLYKQAMKTKIALNFVDQKQKEIDSYKVSSKYIYEREINNVIRYARTICHKNYLLKTGFAFTVLFFLIYLIQNLKGFI